MPRFVRTIRQEPVLSIYLNRPEKRNAIHPEMVLELETAFSMLEDDPDVRVGILAAQGPVFCAGSDLHVTHPGPLRSERGGEYGLVRRARTKPLIAAVDGAALGGGFELALACDMIVASTAAKFGLPEVRRGVIASCGALFRAPQALPRNVATELLLTGAPLDGQRGFELGLVNRLVAPGGALQAASDLAWEIARAAPRAVRTSLGVVRALYENHDAAGWQATDAAVANVGATRDAAEGRRAFFEQREPDWQDE
jgi:enoyl-CoA hydratase